MACVEARRILQTNDDAYFYLTNKGVPSATSYQIRHKICGGLVSPGT